MQKIEITDKEVAEQCRELNNKASSAADGIAAISRQLSDANKALFSLIRSEYPDTEGFKLSYNGETNTITKLYREEK